MARRAMVVLGGLGVLAFAGASAAFVVGMRNNDPRLQDRVRRFNRDVTNPRQMHTAGTPGAYASIVRHRGRTTGREYETPVVAVPTDDGFVFALPYGRERTDWLKNVLAAGRAVVVHEGATFTVDRPELLTAAQANPYFPPGEQRMQRAFGVDDFLRVWTVA